jgi:hypothetical protein
MKLTEGLRAGDLKDQVLPMMTVDEFSSKIDDNKIIVVGFYCFEEDAAHDLSNFIERSPVNVEDTEVSPAPSKEGYYLCFVEMRRQSQFPQKLHELLQEVSRLTHITNWQFTSVKLKPGQVQEFSQQAIQDHVNLKPKSDDQSEQIREWFSHSSLHDVILEHDCLTLCRAGVSWHMQVVEFHDQLPTQALCMETDKLGTAMRLERLLEGGYQAHALSDAVLITHPESHVFLKVRV